MPKTPIIILILGALVGGVFLIANKGDIIPPDKIHKVEFEEADFSLIQENVEFIFLTEVIDGVTTTKKVGIKIPITYLFPVASSTGWVIEEMTEEITVDFVGFNRCRTNGGTKTECLQGLKKQILGNIETTKDSIRGRLEELKRQEFQSEIVEDDF